MVRNLVTLALMASFSAFALDAHDRFPGTGSPAWHLTKQGVVLNSHQQANIDINVSKGNGTYAYTREAGTDVLQVTKHEDSTTSFVEARYNGGITYYRMDSSKKILEYSKCKDSKCEHYDKEFCEHVFRIMPRSEFEHQVRKCAELSGLLENIKKKAAKMAESRDELINKEISRIPGSKNVKMVNSTNAKDSPMTDAFNAYYECNMLDDWKVFYPSDYGSTITKGKKKTTTSKQ